MAEHGLLKEHRLEPGWVLSLRHVGVHSRFGETWAELTAAVMEQGVAGPGTRAISVVYDDPTLHPPETIRCDACLSVDMSKLGHERLRRAARSLCGLRLERLLPRRTVMAVHYGSYASIVWTYWRMMSNVPSARVQAPFFAVHRSNPLLTPASQLVTEVHLPQST